jgi:D-alanine--poly(phosphoribitol) ligase subunit 2
LTQFEKLYEDVISLVESVVLRLVRGDERLLETGLIDSVLAVEIMTNVEMRFGVRIPPTGIAEHLASVDALCAFIAAQR